MNANEQNIRSAGRFVRDSLIDHTANLKACVRHAETESDREFWETQADVLSDVVAAINERIKPKNKE